MHVVLGALWTVLPVDLGLKALPCRGGGGGGGEPTCDRWQPASTTVTTTT